MKNIPFIIGLLFCSCFQIQSQIPVKAEKLIIAYPEQIESYHDNHILFKNGTKLPFDDGKQGKTHNELIINGDIEDMLSYSYPLELEFTLHKNQDVGRIRSDDFFKTMYGRTAGEVKKNLVEIIWCPKLIGQKLKVTIVNDVHKRLEEISLLLDEHPEWEKYLKPAGTFNWRMISGSDHLSSHSFGIAIDLAVSYSNYWQWDCKCKDENVDLNYKNRIPLELVKIFENHGFIWGGKWYHYDTMHFEYRPELLLP